MMVKDSSRVFYELSLFVWFMSDDMFSQGGLVQLSYVTQRARTGCMIRVGNHSHKVIYTLDD